MMAATMLWWRGRSRREQLLLAGMAALFALIVGWLGIVRPLAAARTGAADRLELAQSDLAEVKALTRTIRIAEARAPVANAAPTIEIIRQRVADAGLTADNLAGGDDGRVTLRVAAVKPAALLRWIADLEARDAIRLDRLSVTRNGDATVAAELAFRGVDR